MLHYHFVSRIGQVAVDGPVPGLPKHSCHIVDHFDVGAERVLEARRNGHLRPSVELGSDGVLVGFGIDPVLQLQNCGVPRDWVGGDLECQSL